MLRKSECSPRPRPTGALDTCGLATWETMKRVLEPTDLVLFDLKHLSAEKHLEGTQARNDLILDNLRKTLDSREAAVWIRVPLIPGFNDADSHLEEMALAIGRMPAEKVSLLGFHQWGRSKYRALGREYPHQEVDALPKEGIESAKRMMETQGIEVTIDY